MSVLLLNIGRSVLVCQQIEAVLGSMLVLERKDRFVDSAAFIEEAAKTRTKVLESLKNELTQQGVTYVDYSKLDLVIDRRNWLIHRLPFDREFVKIGLGESSEDFSDLFTFFWQFYEEVMAAYTKRARELGAAGGDWSKEFDPVVAAFGLAIQDRANAMRKRKK